MGNHTSTKIEQPIKTITTVILVKPVDVSSPSISPPLDEEQRDIILQYDVFSNICDYLDSNFIMNNCALVCRQWLEIIQNEAFRLSDVSLPKHFNNNQANLLLGNCRFLRNIAGLRISNNLNDVLIANLDKFENLNRISLDCHEERNIALNMEQVFKIEKLASLKLDSFLSLRNEDLTNLGKMKFLDTLTLRSYNLNETVKKELSELVHLKDLDISCMDLKKVKEEFSFLQKMTQLTMLNLGSRCIGNEGASLIRNLKHLKWLDISKNCLDSNGAKFISEIDNLTFLDISENSIDSEGCKHLCALTNLRTLDLTRNKIDCEGAKHLSELVTPRLTSLQISSNAIQSAGAISLSQLKNLNSLHMRNCELDESCVSAISSMSNLRKLFMTNDNIGFEGEKIIREMKQLEKLELIHRPLPLVQKNNISDYKIYHFE